MKTEPKLIAVKIAGLTPATGAPPVSVANDCAVLKKTKYVGALSSTPDRLPDAQKKCVAEVRPSASPLMLRICSAGCMQMKIPTNSAATSMIAPYVNRLASRISWLPNHKETPTRHNCTISRKYIHGFQSVPGNAL